MNLDLDGNQIKTKADFHTAVKVASGLGFYGENLDALWDLLTGLVERPVTIRWLDASKSKASMGEDFDRILNVIVRAVTYYDDDEFILELSN